MFTKKDLLADFFQEIKVIFSTFIWKAAGECKLKSE